MDNQWFDTRLIQEIGPVYDLQSVFFSDRKKMLFMQTESVLQTKNRSEPAKNRFSVALVCTLFNIYICSHICENFEN